MGTLSSKAFVLEQLEPRLLLSATALDVPNAAPLPSGHVVEISHEANPADASRSHDFLGYTPATQLNEIFEGLTPVQELAQKSAEIHPNPTSQNGKG